MNFLFFAGTAGQMAFVLTLVAFAIGISLVVSILRDGDRLSPLVPLGIAGGAWLVFMAFVAMVAYGVSGVIPSSVRSDVDSSAVVVEDLVPLPGSDSTALAMRDGGFNVAVERDGALVSVSVPDLHYVEANEAPTLSTTTECKLSDGRGFVWNVVYVCTDTLVASVPR